MDFVVIRSLSPLLRHRQTDAACSAACSAAHCRLVQRSCAGLLVCSAGRSNIFLSCRLPYRHCDSLYTTNSCFRVTYFNFTGFASTSPGLFIAPRFFCLGLIWGLIHEIDRCEILSFSFFGTLCTIIPSILYSIYILVLNIFRTFYAILCK